MDKPLVSVILPVFNSEKYIGVSLESMLKQTYTNLQIIVIDDGSTDRTYSILRSYDDKRIKLVRFDENKGLIAALNYGLDLATGDYIARMDADDYSFPDRIQRQIEFLENNPGCAGCGSSIIQWEETQNNLLRYPATSSKIRLCVYLYYHNLCHPTMMFRSIIFDGNKNRFDNRFIHAEDYYLWYNLLENYKFHNIQAPLLKYRIHPYQVSERLSSHQFQTVRKILQEKSYDFFDRPLSEEEQRLHFTLITCEPYDSHIKTDFKRLKEYRNLLIGETTNKIFHEERDLFNATISFKYFKCCIRLNSDPFTSGLALLSLLRMDSAINFYFTGRMITWFTKYLQLKKSKLQKQLEALLNKILHPFNHIVSYRNGLLLRKYSIGFKDIPKTASTSVKHAFYKLQYDREFEYDHINHPKKHIHWYYQSRSIQNAKLRIIIVRDPVDRFLSAYANRVEHHGDLSEKKIKRMPSKDFKFDPSLDEFIKNFSTYARIKAIEWHTRSISKWVGGSFDMYTHVFSFEQIDEFEKLMNSETGKPFKMQRLQKSNKNNLLSRLSPVQLQKIIDIYAEDYILLDGMYSPDTVWSRYFEARSIPNGNIIA